jgi:hypothetical protein
VFIGPSGSGKSLAAAAWYGYARTGHELLEALEGRSRFAGCPGLFTTPSAASSPSSRLASFVLAALLRARPRFASETELSRRSLVNNPGYAATKLLVEATRGLVQRKADQLQQDDAKYDAELADGAEVRGERDGVVDALRQGVIDLREVPTGVFGGKVLATVGLSGSTPEEPVALVAFARNVGKLLRGAKLPPPRLKGVQIDAKAHADALAKLADGAEVAWKAVTQDVREDEAAKLVRDSAMAAHDRSFTRGAGLVEALCRLAGDDELAGRVRPSSRRPGRTQEVANAEPAPAAEALPESE